MRQRELDKIIASAEADYNGDLDVAIAAHLMGDAVILRSGGIVPAGADLAAIAAVRESIEKPKVPPKGLRGGKKKASASPKKARSSKKAIK